MIITIKAKDMQVGDHFKGFGEVQDVRVEDIDVWAHLGRDRYLANWDAEDTIKVSRK